MDAPKCKRCGDRHYGMCPTVVRHLGVGEGEIDTSPQPEVASNIPDDASNTASNEESVLAEKWGQRFRKYLELREAESASTISFKGIPIVWDEDTKERVYFYNTEWREPTDEEVPVARIGKKQRWDRVKYNEYQKEYMRRRRADS